MVLAHKALNVVVRWVICYNTIREKKNRMSYLAGTIVRIMSPQNQCLFRAQVGEDIVHHDAHGHQKYRLNNISTCKRYSVPNSTYLPYIQGRFKACDLYISSDNVPYVPIYGISVGWFGVHDILFDWYLDVVF